MYGQRRLAWGVPCAATALAGGVQPPRTRLNSPCPLVPLLVRINFASSPVQTKVARQRTMAWTRLLHARRKIIKELFDPGGGS